MIATFSKLMVKIFGSRNERLLKRFRAMVEGVTEAEPKVQAMTDAQLKERTQELRNEITAGKLRTSDVLNEALAIIRESMDRNIGIRSIFNPEEHFDPDKLDDTMLEVYDQVQRRMIATGEPWQKVEIPHELYGAVRKLYPESRPPFRARCFDVQLIGGLVLYEGRIAEMATGEGKTFVAPLACFLRALEGMHCHVVTVNDYLVRRDAEWIMPAFEALGLRVGFIQSDMEPGGEKRRRMYECDVTYGTNSEFGFDYLRDNMKERADLQVQGSLDFAIVDEVDSILIDEARTPLIISGAAHDDAPKYKAADIVARKVMELNRPWTAVEKEEESAKRSIKAAQGDEERAKGDKGEIEAARKRREEAVKQLEAAEKKKAGLVQYYEVELDRKSVHLTHEGIAAAQDEAGVGSFFVGNNMEWPHLMEQSMRAHVVYERDRDYVVERGKQSGQLEVIIVDEYTGRKMEGRQWSDGLHQAVEAKERVQIKQETQTLATITLQNFFKMYRQLSGMTGTAQTEAEEFNKIYSLEVVTIPTNRPVVRRDSDDRVYRTPDEKWDAIIDEVKLYSDQGRPVLIGTTSVDRSEMLSERLKRKYGIEHEVLNAKHHEREASIVAKAGQTHTNAHGEVVGNVTIATNMAGRGTDIKLAQEALYEVEGVEDGEKGAKKYALKQRGTGKLLEVLDTDPVASAFTLSPTTKLTGGLHVIGTERHTARRIDNQLRGRGGRQGDPGSSRFYVSLQDDLLKMFMSEWAVNIFKKIGMDYGEAIESPMLSRGILRAQKKVEERNFLGRKNLLEYDEVMDYQRTNFYSMRQRVLEGRGVDDIIWGMIGEAIQDAVRRYIEEDYVSTVVSEWARVNFQVAIDPGDLKSRKHASDIELYVRTRARAEAEQDVTVQLEEFMGEDPENPSQWNTREIAAWAMSRFHVQLSQGQIRKMDAKTLEQTLVAAAHQNIDSRDVTGMLKYLEPLFAENELAAWAREKFDIDVAGSEFVDDPERNIRKPTDEIVAHIEKRARETYARREVEHPVDQMLTLAYGQEPPATAENPYANQGLRNWAMAKYGVDIPHDHMAQLSVRNLRDELIGLQEQFLLDGKLDKEVDALVAANPDRTKLLEVVNQRFYANVSLKDPVDGPAPSRKATPLGAKAEAPRTTWAEADAQAVRAGVRRVGRQFLRSELTSLEQFVLIQILDNSWKDHLYAMDMLKSGVGLQAFAEKDPRVIYKVEGYQYFQNMMESIRDKVTNLIFHARVSGSLQSRSAYRETGAQHKVNDSYAVADNIEPAADLPGEAAPGQEGASASGGEVTATKVKQIVNTAPKVGRNDPCPCGSGKKYKKCCGAGAA